MALSACPEHLRGYVGRFLQETTANLFVGKVSERVGELLWETVCRHVGSGSGVLVTTAASETGYRLRTVGAPGIEIMDADGIDMPLVVHCRSE